MNWTMKVTHWGYSLYWRGELVASSTNPIDLMRYVATHHTQATAPSFSS